MANKLINQNSLKAVMPFTVLIAHLRLVHLLAGRYMLGRTSKDVGVKQWIKLHFSKG